MKYMFCVNVQMEWCTMRQRCKWLLVCCCVCPGKLSFIRWIDHRCDDGRQMRINIIESLCNNFFFFINVSMARSEFHRNDALTSDTFNANRCIDLTSVCVVFSAHNCALHLAHRWAGDDSNVHTILYGVIATLNFFEWYSPSEKTHALELMQANPFNRLSLSLSLCIIHNSSWHSSVCFGFVTCIRFAVEPRKLVMNWNCNGIKMKWNNNNNRQNIQMRRAPQRNKHQMLRNI